MTGSHGGMSKPMSEEAYRLLSTAPRQEGLPYVLRSPRNPMKHLTTGEYYGSWSRNLKVAGVTHVGTHGILHRSASDIANSGIPVNVGMMLTAHETVAMFMRYVHTEDAGTRCGRVGGEPAQERGGRAIDGVEPSQAALTSSKAPYK